MQAVVEALHFDSGIAMACRKVAVKAMVTHLKEGKTRVYILQSVLHPMTGREYRDLCNFLRKYNHSTSDADVREH